MKKSRFKVRITIWFSLALLVMCLLMGAVIISLYRMKMENSVLDNLQVVIDECAKMIESDTELQQLLRESGIDTADNSGFLQDDVFLMIYREDKSRACFFRSFPFPAVFFIFRRIIADISCGE